MNNTMGNNDMLGVAGQDMAAPGVAGNTTDPATGAYVPPSPPVQANPVAMVNNKALSPIGNASKVANNMEINSNIPMHLRANNQLNQTI
jgi:hypothetical protein